MKIPEPYHTIAAKIDASFEADSQHPRPHLGVSSLGHHCDRWLWLSFRWAVWPSFPGRILRLFRRGHREEETVVADLKRIGCKISNTGTNQAFVRFGAHVSGSADGIIEGGLPGAENTRHLLEIKTHSKKSFDDLTAYGVKESKPEHYTQMQAYMHGLKLERGLYYAICKDDDRIYTERVRLDAKHAEKAIARGKRIALADRMPEPCAGASLSWYLCKWCQGYGFCHQDEAVEHKNCRTCGYSTAKEDNTFYCEKWEDTIPKEAQMAGCEGFEMHPHLAGGER